jgi:hypothetical protein
MRDRDPRRTARREARQRQREHLGIAVPPCVLCIQKHHTAGRHHDAKLTEQLCEMHHREQHEQIMRAGLSPEYEPDEIKRVALALRWAAVYDRARADAMEHWADLLNQSEGDHQ